MRMLTARALMFVHMEMDAEQQWEKAVDSLTRMSNLEIALVWGKLSSLAPKDDFKTHSEYKCLFKRAVREAECRGGVCHGETSDSHVNRGYVEGYQSSEQGDIATARALMFVHMGMDVERQWEKAVDSLMNMSNLDTALVWKGLSSLSLLGDHRLHSEYKCLFKRALKEAESRKIGCVTEVCCKGEGVDEESDFAEYTRYQSDEIYDTTRVGSPPELRFNWGNEPGEAFEKFNSETLTPKTTPRTIPVDLPVFEALGGVIDRKKRPSTAPQSRTRIDESKWRVP